MCSSADTSRTTTNPWDKVMRSKFLFLVLLLGTGLLTSGLSAADQARPIRIGALTDSWGPTPGVVGLRDGLQQLGYREHEQFVIGVRFTQGDVAALPAAARELVQQGVDILFTSNPSSAMAAQRVTSKIPIVFANAGDPVGLGLIRAFSRPGGNITGVTDLDLELGPKRLEFLHEIIAGLKRVLFLHDPTEAFSVAEAKGYRQAAQRIGIVLVEKAVRTEEDAQSTIARLRNDDVQGIVAPRSLSLNIPGFILDATSQKVMPTMFPDIWYVENGGLVSYSPDFHQSGRKAARLVDKILKGANPGEIPVEVNTKIELVINVKVAKALRLEIPPEVLFRADRLIR
jgi:putative tryptophan/tyrosine transport system substrate-binding protein